jgi:hypothetical protein
MPAQRDKYVKIVLADLLNEFRSDTIDSSLQNVSKGIVSLHRFESADFEAIQSLDPSDCCSLIANF